MSNACEDWPACGHEAGCCPAFDSDTGEQLDMKCVCGVSVSLTSRSSLCASCLKSDDEEYYTGLTERLEAIENEYDF